MRKGLVLILSAAFASPCAASPELTADITVSSQSTPPPLSESLPSTTGGFSLAREGKPLEMTIWGGTGAIVGSLAGPMGTVVGAAVGALGGLLISVFVVPHNGPERETSTRPRLPRRGEKIPLDKFPT